MRKGLFFVLLLAAIAAISFSTSGCTDKKPAADTLSVDTTATDTTAVDTMENLISETPMPKAADELFDEFRFNFAANKKLQMQRILFPLKVTQGKSTSTIQKKQWKREYFFMHQDFYTLIFDNVKQMNVVKDTTIDHVIIEKIYFDQKNVKQYLFDRINGRWMLTSINYKPMFQNLNASFLKFYHHFVTDSAFQVQSINDPLTFIGPDPDDDFSTMTGSVAPEQWSSFAPELPKGLIYNILYGQKYTESNMKIFVIRGIANGLETELTFKRMGGKWKLVKLRT